MLQILLGAIIAIITTIFIENLRKPRLSLTLTESVNLEYEGRPAKHARYLLLDLRNSPLPRIAKWMSRNTASQCHGFITFHHLDGQNFFGRQMTVRWSGSPEPIPLQIHMEGKVGHIIDPARLTVSSKVDIPPGEGWKVDIAAKFDDDKECYGWSNESYLCETPWRNPEWKIPLGRYLVKVTIISAGEKVSKIVRLINDVGRSDFRLEEAMVKDSVRS